MSTDRIHARRWWILAILCVSLFVTVVDTTIVNVALPTFALDLEASTRQLQWILDAYNLVFAGLLLAFGGLGDRYGRRRALVAGLIGFGATSALAAMAGSATGLVAARGLMGVAAALIFPATLAILTNVFTEPGERARAIAIWTAVTGVGVATGPIVGGWLLSHYSWGSIFLVNVPVTIVAAGLVLAFVPESRDVTTPRLDIVGVLLSIAAIGTLVFTIIEAPELGWTSAAAITGFIAAAVLLVAFVLWELHNPHPMLPVRIFRNLRFTAASVAVTTGFFALFGFIFLITQYFQLIRGYTPLEAGVRTVPFALAVAVMSMAGAHLAEQFGTTRVVAGGLAAMAGGFAWVSVASAGTPYVEIVLQMFLLGGGLGAATAPATESIMGSLPLDKAGIGSAVNDTTRELGGTLGVAVVGSVFNSVYVSELAGSSVAATLPDGVRETAQESVGAAQVVAGGLGDAAPAFLAEVSDAFLAGLGVACLVTAAAALAGAAFAARFLPPRAVDSAQAAEPTTVLR